MYLLKTRVVNESKIFPTINDYLEKELFCQSGRITFGPKKWRHVYYFSNRTGKKIVKIIAQTTLSPVFEYCYSFDSIVSETTNG